MSSTNKTANLHLNQWVSTDGVCMADFNADNEAIDAALASIPHVETGSYVGSGNCGGGPNRNTLTFSRRPKLVRVSPAQGTADGSYACFVANYGQAYAPNTYINAGGNTIYVHLEWSGNTVSWYAEGAAAQFNSTAVTYNWFAVC